MVAEASVGELFIGGGPPRLLLAALFLGYIIIACWIKPEWAPAAPADEVNVPLAKKMAMLKGLIMPGILGGSVMGSIYTGIATPSEAAGILDNAPENLARWLKNPQAVKPGSLIPNLSLADDDITALVAYLQSLK